MDRYKDTKKAGIYGIIGNIFLLIIKGLISISTHSQAMLADTVNSFSDVFASFMTYIGNKIASSPKDESHNFGHGKAEYIFSLFISIGMLYLSFSLVSSSIHSYINKEHMTFSIFLILVCVITIVLKVFLFFYTDKLYKKYNNILLKANSKEHRNDCIASFSALLSTVASYFNIFWLDTLVGSCISIWIFVTGIKILIESCNILMDKSIDKNIKENIINIVQKFPTVKYISNFSSTPVGYQYLVVLTICVDGNMTTKDSHSLADKIEEKLQNNANIYKIIVHIHPM